MVNLDSGFNRIYYIKGQGTLKLQILSRCPIYAG